MSKTSRSGPFLLEYSTLWLAPRRRQQEQPQAFTSQPSPAKSVGPLPFPSSNVFMMKYDVLTLVSSSSDAGESFNDDEDTNGDFTQLLVSDDNPCQESTCYTCIGTRTHLFLTIFAMIILATTHTMSTHQQCNNRDGAILPTADQSPHIAWLMSFPNSGTSYTLRLVQAVSNTTGK